MSKDKLKELFREKLYNHETPVRQSDWEIISERLKAKRKRKVFILFYVYSATGIAAALLIAMLLLKPESENISDSITASVDTQNVENIAGRTDKTTLIADTDTVLEEITEKNTNSAGNKSFRTFAGIAAKIDSDFEQNSNNGKTNTIEEFEEDSKKEQHNTLAENIDNQVETIENQIETAENKQTESTKKEKEPQQNINNEWWNIPDTEQNTTKSNSSWTLAFVSGQSVGKNSTISDFSHEIWTRNFASDGKMFNSSNSLFMSGQNNTQNTLSSTPYARAGKLKDMKHNRPLNFGLRITKNVNNRIRIKTGLSYSYFLSELNEPDVKIQQKIYYAGIPVGAEFLLWEKNRFNIYASGEFAVEKGVACYFNHSWRTLIETTEVFTHAGSVRGLQFSANAGLGISYSLIYNFGIYVEPNAVYYIKDSRQPQSFRTEKPFNFGINVGLKYDF